MEKSLATLKQMAQRLGASMNIIRERIVETSEDDDDIGIVLDNEDSSGQINNRENQEPNCARNEEKVKPTEKRKKRKTAVEVLIRRVPEDSQFIDIRIAVLGNVDCGKSTLISVLTYDEPDNGQGRARLNLLRHIHEIQTGRTSSISKEIMGFNDAAEVFYCLLYIFFFFFCQLIGLI